MSYSPYFFEEILRCNRLEMQRNELQAQLRAEHRAAQPARTSLLARGRMLISRVPRARRARVAYT